MKHKEVESAEMISKPYSILGQFDGMCADAEITNENGLDITREVWEHVFDSDDYKKGIELGHFIGFLGHPDDPGCQDFEHACIVMKEGHIDNDGKVYGKFDLVNTPVGKIVKTFIDAGVTFGISVRGAGDIIDNSVDPDTFIFRGFDLVTFPAYKEAIPTFTDVAASSDVEVQKKYKRVCAAVKNNIDALNTVASVSILQSQFAKQSEEYKMLENRKHILSGEEVKPESIENQKIECLTDMYLDAKQELVECKAKLADASKKNRILSSTIRQDRRDNARKIDSIKRVYASQFEDMKDSIADQIHKYQTVKASSNKMKNEIVSLKRENERLESVFSSKELQLRNEIKRLKDSNLTYKQKIEANNNIIRDKDSVIRKLESDLRETVTASSEMQAKTSNRDAEIQKLKEEIVASTRLIHQYQNAYANLYANAVGTRVEDMPITSATTVDELKSMITASSSVGIKPSFAAPEQIDEVLDESLSDDSLVTL